MPKPRKPGMPRGRRPPADPRQGVFGFEKIEQPSRKMEPNPNRAPEISKTTSKKIRPPIVRISSVVTKVGHSRVTDWHIGSIGVPANAEERALLETRIARIIASARKANVHRILFTQDENRGPVAELLRKLDFSCKVDTSGGHSREDAYYIFTRNIH
jgi:hypothetical protein